MKGTAIVELDDSPLRIEPPTDADYTSRQVCSALYRPLVKWSYRDRCVTASVIRSWIASDDGLSWTFKLGDCCWSDGARINSNDCIRGIAAAVRHPVWRRYLNPIAAIEAASDDELRLKLRHRFAPLLNLLATVDLAPLPPQAGVFSGAYALVESQPGSRYELTPQSCKGAALTFVVSRGRTPSIEGYQNGTYDVTSNTGFPLDRVAEWRSHASFRSGETGITMQLEINPAGTSWLRQPAVRRMLFVALDRAAIVQDLASCVRVAAHFGPACWDELNALRLPASNPQLARRMMATAGRPGRPIRIHFNDYPPNRDVIEAVARQWKEVLGLESELVAVPFAQVDRSDFDLLLALRYPTFPSPWATLEHFAILSRLLGAASAREQAEVLNSWPGDGAAQRLAVSRLRDLVSDAFPVIPLFHLNGYWLERSGVSFAYPPDGYFVYGEGAGRL